MDRVEYQITFMTFFIGLGVADLFISIIRLLKNRERVTWHWLPLAWSVIAFLGLIIGWMAYHSMFQEDFTATGPGFLLAILPAIFIFAFTVSVLPHDIPPEGIDLKVYYFRQHRLIFSLYFLDMTTRTLTQVFLLDPMPVQFWIVAGLIQVLIFVMIFTKNYRYHVLATAVLFFFVLTFFLGSRFAN